MKELPPKLHVKLKNKPLKAKNDGAGENAASVKVPEDTGSDVCESSYDDDVADRSYVPSTLSTSDDEMPSPQNERYLKHGVMSRAQRRVHRRLHPTVSGGAVQELDATSGVSASVEAPRQEHTSSGLPNSSDLTYLGQINRKRRKPLNIYDKKNFRWSLELLHTAICKHEWDNAFKLLPCVITQAAPHLSLEFLWRVTDIITRNVSSVTQIERRRFISILHGMKLKTSMFLDILSQDLAKATDRDADELLQMIEDIHNQKQPALHGKTATDKRFKALSDGYVGLVHYQRWKGLQHATSSSQTLDDASFTASFPESQETANSSKELVRTAHSFLKKALNGFNEPCDWLMLQLLELEKELSGQESAISVLKRYKNDPRRAPAHHLAYHFYKNLVPGSIEEQLMELECISKECPDDPLVLEQVDLYLHSLEHGGPVMERAMAHSKGTESDSGLENSDDSQSHSSLPTETTCTLKSRGKVEVLYKCLGLLVSLLDYPNHIWELEPWEKLTQVLCKFYQAWLRCWMCLACRSTRRRIHRLARTVVPLWKYYVWKDPPDNLSLEHGRILLHHVFAAFIFGYSEQYMFRSLSVLGKSGHIHLREELVSLMNFPGPFLKNFTMVAEKYRMRLESISLTSLSQIATKAKQSHHTREGTVSATRTTIINSSQNHLQDILEDQPNESHIQSEMELFPLPPFKEYSNGGSKNNSISHSKNSNGNILIEETGLSPKSVSDIFDESFEGDFVTSTQNKKESCKQKKQPVDDAELNGTYIACQETNRDVNENFASTSNSLKKKDDCSQTKIKLRRSPRNLSPNSIERECQGQRNASGKSRTQKTSTLSKTKALVPEVDPLKKTRLSKRRIYQPHNKDTSTPNKKTVQDADQDHSTKEPDHISRVVQGSDVDRSAGDSINFDDSQEQMGQEIHEDTMMSPEGEKEQAIHDKVKSTVEEMPEKKRLFDESRNTDPKETKQDGNVGVESSVEKDSESINASSSSSSLEDVRVTQIPCHINEEIKRDKPEYSTSDGGKMQEKDKDITMTSPEHNEKDESNQLECGRSSSINNKEGNKKEKPKQELKHQEDRTEEKENSAQKCNTKSKPPRINKDKHQDPNTSPATHAIGSVSNKNPQRTLKKIRSEKQAFKRSVEETVIVYGTETQSYDEGSDGASQVVLETQSQADMRDTTEERHTDQVKEEDDGADQRMQNNVVQGEDYDEADGRKLSEEIQVEVQTQEEEYDETSQGKQNQVVEKEVEPRIQDDDGVLSQEYPQCSYDVLPPGQMVRVFTSSLDNPAPVSQSGQGFLLMQDQGTSECLPPLVSEASVDVKTDNFDIREINLDELNDLELGDLDCSLLKRLVDEEYNNSIKEQEDSCQMQQWDSDATPDGLVESKEGEILVEAEHNIQDQKKEEITRKSPKKKHESPTKKALGPKNRSPQKSSDQIISSPQKALDSEKRFVQKELHGEGKSAVKSPKQLRRISPNKVKVKWPLPTRHSQTPAIRHPRMIRSTFYMENLPTPSMQDIVKHSDTSTPNISRRQRNKVSAKCGSITHLQTHYPAFWLEDLPLPGMEKNAAVRTNKETETLEAQERSESVLSDASSKKLSNRRKKKRRDSASHESSESLFSDTSTVKTKKSSSKINQKLRHPGALESLEPIPIDSELRALPDDVDEEILNSPRKDCTDVLSLCGKEESYEPLPEPRTSVPTAEEALITGNNQESETENNLGHSVIDEVNESLIHEDQDEGLEVSPQRNHSFGTEEEESVLGNEEENVLGNEEEENVLGNEEEENVLGNEEEENVLGNEEEENVLGNEEEENVLGNEEEENVLGNEEEENVLGNEEEENVLGNEEEENVLGNEEEENVLGNEEEENVLGNEEEENVLGNEEENVLGNEEENVLGNEEEENVLGNEEEENVLGNEEEENVLENEEEENVLGNEEEENVLGNEEEENVLGNEEEGNVLGNEEEGNVLEKEEENVLGNEEEENVLGNEEEGNVLGNEEEGNVLGNEEEGNVLEKEEENVLGNEEEENVLGNEEEENVLGNEEEGNVLGNEEEGNVLGNDHEHFMEADQYGAKTDWLKDLPLHDKDRDRSLETSYENNDTSGPKTKKTHSKRRKDSCNVPVEDWIKDLPIFNENKPSDIDTSSERMNTEKLSTKRKKKSMNREGHETSEPVLADTSIEEDKSLKSRKKKERKSEALKTSEPVLADSSTGNERLFRSRKKKKRDSETLERSELVLADSSTGEERSLTSKKKKERDSETLESSEPVLADTSTGNERSLKSRKKKERESEALETLEPLLADTSTGDERSLKSRQKKERDLEGPTISYNYSSETVTVTTSKHQIESKSKRLETILGWTEGLPLREERIQMILQDSFKKYDSPQVDKRPLSNRLHQSVDDDNDDQNVISPLSVRDDDDNDEHQGETHRTSHHSKKEIDQWTMTRSKKRKRADSSLATESNTYITVEEEKPKKKKKRKSGRKRADRLSATESNTRITDGEEKHKNKKKKKRRSGEMQSSPSKVTDPSPTSAVTQDQEETEREEEDNLRGVILSPLRKHIQTTEGEDHKNVTTEECKEGTRERRRKRKKRKTRQDECERGSSDNTPRNAGNPGEEKYKGETSYYSTSEGSTKDRRKRKHRRRMRQEEHERGSTPDSQRNVEDQRHEEYEREISYRRTSEENSERKGRKHSSKQEKDTPYRVETVWHSNSVLTVNTSKRKHTHIDKDDLVRGSSRPSKRRKTESSRRSNETNTALDHSFSITVCNNIENTSDMKITLCRSPDLDATTSADKGIRVTIQLTDRSTQGRLHLHTPVADGMDGSDVNQDKKSDGVTPHKSPASARKRKLFKNVNGKSSAFFK